MFNLHVPMFLFYTHTLSIIISPLVMTKYSYICILKKGIIFIKASVF